MKPSLGSTLSLISFMVAATPALGADRLAQERAARKACLTGDPGKGVEILSDLFIDTKNSVHIFNQGRCFEQNRRYEDAIGRFEEYLRVGGSSLTQEDREFAKQHIKDCRETLERERAASVPSTPPAFVPPPTEAATNPSPSPETALAQPSLPSGKTGAGLRLAGIVTASVGVAAVVGGILFNVKANSMIGDMEASPGAYSRDKASDRRTYETMAWIGYGAGAACVVTGAVLYALGWKSRQRSSTNVALVPVLSPGQAGALLAGGF